MRIVHYINQFFGQVGGEDMAGHPFEVREGVVGPGMAMKAQLKDIGEITATVVCGDNYAVENADLFREQLIKTLQEQKADLLIAGPAFNAGRYGMACGMACKIAYEDLGIEAVSGMYEENPGLEIYRKFAYIVPTGNSARGMRDAVAAIKGIVEKIAAGEDLGTPEEGGFFERGFRKNFYAEKTGAQRMADMLVTKMRGDEYKTEMPMPLFEKVTPSPAIEDTGKARIIVMTSGGMVPLGNPDHLEACNCTKYKRYNFDESYGGKGVTKGLVVHGSYDPVYGNEDGNRILPVDALVELEKEGRIGELCDFTFVTVGNGMGTDQAAKFGEAIAEELKREQIQGAILTSTWGTCTRCGATIVKTIDKAGIPIVHVCTVTPISISVGANRVVPAVSIPHPVGRPDLPIEEEKAYRKKMMETALKALETDITEQTLFPVE